MFDSSSRKQKGLSPSHASLQVLSQPREKVGKECHASDEREGPTGPCGSVHVAHTTGLLQSNTKKKVFSSFSFSFSLIFLKECFLFRPGASRLLKSQLFSNTQVLLVAASPIFADSAALRLLLCPLFPWPFRRLLAFLCCCSADTLRPAAAVAALLDASIRLRGLSPRPIQAGVGNLPRHT